MVDSTYQVERILWELVASLLLILFLLQLTNLLLKSKQERKSKAIGLFIHSVIPIALVVDLVRGIDLRSVYGIISTEVTMLLTDIVNIITLLPLVNLALTIYRAYFKQMNRPMPSFLTASHWAIYALMTICILTFDFLCIADSHNWLERAGALALHIAVLYWLFFHTWISFKLWRYINNFIQQVKLGQLAVTVKPKATTVSRAQ